MNLVIDNNDGAGGVDYTAALLREKPLTITRQHGEWARCAGGLDINGTGLPVPADRARVLVTDGSGVILFRGFLQADARQSNDERGLLADTPAFLALEAGWLTGGVPPVDLQPATAVIHTMVESDVAVTYATPPHKAAEELATDVTVEGGEEAANYVTELFRGDGTTQNFALAHAPFREAGSSTLLEDSFDDPLLNTARWVRRDPGSYLSLGSGGLRIGGGNGLDGTTVLQYASPVEMGGTVVAEATGVLLTTGSDGMLMGFYNGAVVHDSCVAGIRVHGEAGSHNLIAVVNGVEKRTTYNFADGHNYVLRIRLHCAEMQRMRGTYSALVDGVLQTFGGDTLTAPLHIVVEVLDPGLASNTLATVLFDGAIAASPPQCIFAPVNSAQLQGSLSKVSLKQTGSAWVVSTATDGTITTRRSGAAGTGADYGMSSTGVIVFDPGRVPQPGELVTVNYRRSKRAIARRKDAASDNARAQLALPGLPAWTGTVSRPAARSTADCAAAAQALLALATGAVTQQPGRAAWLRGTATTDDVLPGDTLALRMAEVVRNLPVRSVTITDGNTVPELLKYEADFVQNRAGGLSFAVSNGTHGDLLLPVAMTADVSALPPALAGLQVTVANGTQLQIESGMDAPEGGGFEVRRSDANFGSASTGDLVLNSPVRHFSIPRLAFNERFFVRVYDGSTPPNYSAVSSEVLTSLPLS